MPELTWLLAVVTRGRALSGDIPAEVAFHESAAWHPEQLLEK